MLIKLLPGAMNPPHHWEAAVKRNIDVCLDRAHCIPTGENEIETQHGIPAGEKGRAEKGWEVGGQGKLCEGLELVRA